MLIVDHFFDDADDPTPGADTTVRSDLTLVPCSEDLNLQVPATVVAQFLVFNEFEQRFSTSTSVTCFRELALSDIATRAGASDDFTSIFNVNVSGTLTGQTTVRGVADNNPTTGRGLLAVLEEFHGRGTGVEFVPEFSAAVNVHQRGIRTQADIIQLPSVQTGSTGQ